MKRCTQNLLIIIANLFFIGCGTISDSPCQLPEDDLLVEIRFSLTIDMNIDVDNVQEINSALSSSAEGGYNVRYIVDVYKADTSSGTIPSEKIARIVQIGNRINPDGLVVIDQTVKLPPMDYFVIVWVDFTDQGNSDMYYDTKELLSISIINPTGRYTGYTPERDAFCGGIKMHLSKWEGHPGEVYQQNCPIKRPFGMYQIITTDVDEYLASRNLLSSYDSIRPSVTNLAYQLYFPMGYDLRYQVQNNYLSNIGYKYDIVETIPKKEAVIASDYVFLSDDAYFYLNLDIADARNVHINTVEGLKINLKRNRKTIIRGKFLTRNLNDGKVGVDDGFDDEIIVGID